MPRIINLYYDLNDNKVRNFLRKQKGMILDAGCGTGRFLAYADIGTDFSKGMLNQAKKKKKSLVRASILDLPFRDETFSVALSIDVFLHIKPAEQKIARSELQRVARRFYIFLGEHRTVFPFIYQFFQTSPLKPKRVFPYLALLFAFPLDRLKHINFSASSF